MCPECGQRFDNVGLHWRWNPEHRPSITNRQNQIITGVLMGDGTLYRGNKTPYLRIKMITEEYLEYLSGIFGVLTTGVELEKTANESAQSVLDSGFYETVNIENYNNIYEMRVRCHPEFEEYESWYDSGEKVWPNNLELTPTVLKHWYCCDGTYVNNHIEIGMSNEVDNINKVSNYFKRVGLPKPSNYNTSNGTCIAEFSVDNSHYLLDYMGESLPGFEYKWGN